MGAANGALDAGAGHELGDGASKCKIGSETPIAGGDWNQPTGAVDQRSHSAGRNLDGFLGSDLQVLGRAANALLVGAGCAVAEWDIFGDVSVGLYGVRGFGHGYSFQSSR